MKLKGNANKKPNPNSPTQFILVLSKQCYPEPTKHTMDTLFLVYSNLLSPSVQYTLCAIKKLGAGR